MPWEKNDLFFFFTDALSELPGKGKEDLVNTFLPRIKENCDTLTRAGEKIFETLKTFSPTPADDATIMLLKIK